MGRLASGTQSLVEPAYGLVNYTVLDTAGWPMTFALNLNPDPIGVSIRRPAKGRVVDVLDGGGNVGDAMRLRPCVPTILRVE